MCAEKVVVLITAFLCEELTGLLCRFWAAESVLHPQITPVPFITVTHTKGGHLTRRTRRAMGSFPLNNDKYSLMPFPARLQYTQLLQLTTKWNLCCDCMLSACFRDSSSLPWEQKPRRRAVFLVIKQKLCTQWVDSHHQAPDKALQGPFPHVWL